MAKLTKSKAKTTSKKTSLAKHGGQNDAKDEQQEVFTFTDRMFYELYLKDAKHKLQFYGQQLNDFEANKVVLVEEMRVLQEDKTDAPGHLTRVLIERNKEITDLNEQIAEIEKNCDEMRKNSNKTIQDLETKHKMMNDQLSLEIKQIRGNINTLLDFESEQEQLNRRYELQVEELNERVDYYESTLLQTENNNEDRELLRNEVEIKLQQNAVELAHSTKSSGANYNEPLVRENIALKKEINMVSESHHKLLEEKAKKLTQYENMKKQLADLEKLKRELLHTAQNKIRMIEKLCSSYEKLERKYRKSTGYYQRYQKFLASTKCSKPRDPNYLQRVLQLQQCIDRTTIERNNLLASQQQKQNRIKYLREVINAMKAQVKAAIQNKCQTVTDTDMLPSDDVFVSKQTPCDNLLITLLDLVNETPDFAPSPLSDQTLSCKSSIFCLQDELDVEKHYSYMDKFTTESCLVDTDQFDLSEDGKVMDEKTIIPKPHYFDKLVIIDVEEGSPLYCSSPRDDLEILNFEDEEFENDESSSSHNNPSSTISHISQNTTDLSVEDKSDELSSMSASKKSVLSKKSKTVGYTKSSITSYGSQTEEDTTFDEEGIASIELDEFSVEEITDENW